MTLPFVLSVLGAIAAGMVVQSILAYRQSKAFSAVVRDLRSHGTVAVGGGGKRYRGGRAFVAVATDPHGRVAIAMSLSGWTTFARPIELHQVRGLRLSQLRRDEPIPLVGPPQRLALQDAAQHLHKHLVKAA